MEGTFKLGRYYAPRILDNIQLINLNHGTSGSCDSEVNVPCDPDGCRCDGSYCVEDYDCPWLCSTVGRDCTTHCTAECPTLARVSCDTKACIVDGSETDACAKDMCGIAACGTDICLINVSQNKARAANVCAIDFPVL